ncbi:MAG: phenylalanine--tRNA ligase subunit alpha [Chlorobi bacterium]|nr:phenylalanine--tRNA ligase subunit alpha [Chlorobiota bacterium]
MLEEISKTKLEIEAAAANISSREDLQAFRVTYLARKGKIASLFARLRDVPPEQKRSVGQELNALRSFAEELFKEREKHFEESRKEKKGFLDYTLPGREFPLGHTHIVSRTIADIQSIFVRMGFSIATGPELESDYYNFETLNFPADHPARDMQDTFFIEKDVVLRTHTSPVQIRLMESRKPPIRAIMPGRCYRNEVISARSHVQFHQIEGLCVDTRVTFTDLKSTLVAFAREFYGETTAYRFRPSYFPFTEPSAEMDISCFLCHGDGCRVCKFTGWLEVLGCGMVDPNVFKAVGYDPEELTGYAFGMGIERTAMLRHNIPDIRLIFENDARMLRQLG